MGHYITTSGKKVDLQPNDKIQNNNQIDVQSMGISHLEVPNNYVDLWCGDNIITSLNLPLSIKDVFCQGNKLQNLILHEGVECVSCEFNNIKSLTIPSTLRILWCDQMDGIEDQYKKDMSIKIYQSNYVY